jgi:hypothetical protein
MFEYLELSDGTTTLELTDNVSYSLVSYAPQIGVLRDNELGGRGPYQDAADTIDRACDGYHRRAGLRCGRCAE